LTQLCVPSQFNGEFNNKDKLPNFDIEFRLFSLHSFVCVDFISLDGRQK